METSEIVSHVAHLLRQKARWDKDPNRDVKLRNEPVAHAQDEVKLTQTGAQYAASAGSADYDQEQSMKVERLKALVENGHYHMDDNVVATIASNIAKMFL